MKKQENKKFGERYYPILLNKEVEQFGSVTTITSFKKNPALIQWALAMGREKADQVSKESAGIGNDIHYLIQQHLFEKKIIHLGDLAPELHKPFEAFLDWKRSVNMSVLDVEQTVYHGYYKYAGRLDMVAEINGKVCVVDWKTSGAIYNTMVLQACAYFWALVEMINDKQTLKFETQNKTYSVVDLDYAYGLPESVWIIRLDKKTGKAEPLEIKGKALQSQFDKFIALKDLWEWDKATNTPKRLREYLEKEG